MDLQHHLKAGELEQFFWLGGPTALSSVAAVLQDLVLDKEASQTSQVERENLMSLFLLNFAVAAPLGKNKYSTLLHLQFNQVRLQKITLLSCSILTYKY